MKLAQLETFQYLLNELSMLPETKSYKLVFALNERLYTADLYQNHGNLPNQVSYKKVVVGENGFYFFKDKALSNDFSLIQGLNRLQSHEFCSTYIGTSNLKNADVVFRILFNLVSDLKDGKATSPFIYKIKSLDGKVDLPFYKVSATDTLEPVSLIESDL